MNKKKRYFLRREKAGRLKETHTQVTPSEYTIVVTIAERIHLFPFRTQKLSFLTPKVVPLTGRKDRSLPHLLPLSSVG